MSTTGKIGYLAFYVGVLLGVVYLVKGLVGKWEFLPLLISIVLILAGLALLRRDPSFGIALLWRIPPVHSTAELVGYRLVLSTGVLLVTALANHIAPWDPYTDIFVDSIFYAGALLFVLGLSLWFGALPVRRTSR